MTVAKQLYKQLSLRKSLEYAGTSRCVWHHTPKERPDKDDEKIIAAIHDIAKTRPTYGTRRMAAQISRNTSIAVEEINN